MPQRHGRMTGPADREKQGRGREQSGLRIGSSVIALPTPGRPALRACIACRDSFEDRRSDCNRVRARSALNG